MRNAKTVLNNFFHSRLCGLLLWGSLLTSSCIWFYLLMPVAQDWLDYLIVGVLAAVLGAITAFEFTICVFILVLLIWTLVKLIKIVRV